MRRALFDAPIIERTSRRTILRRLAVFSFGLTVSGGMVASFRPTAAAPARRPTHLVLASGHHNLSSGHPTEIQLVGPLTRAIAHACRGLGLSVRIVTPDEGLGTFPGRVTDVGRHVVAWHQTGWPVDIFLEVHAEANQSGNAGRGCFVVYPDTDDDLDIVARDQLGPDLVHHLSSATGIPLRGNGLMSERQTAVGARGRRLGVFRATAPIRHHCSRLIIEVGAHTAPADLAVLQQPDYRERAAAAVATAIAEYAARAPALDSGLARDAIWEINAGVVSAYAAALRSSGTTRGEP